MTTVSFTPIGVIRSEHREAARTPIQPVFAAGARDEAVVEERFLEGLKDLDGFSHVFLIYHFHLAGPAALTVKPYLDQTWRGVFAARAPQRPNPIGTSLVRLVGREGNRLLLADVNIVDGTPLLDIKPFVPRFDAAPNARGGWTEQLDPPAGAGGRGWRPADRVEAERKENE